jgi:hypothetical protein
MPLLLLLPTCHSFGDANFEGSDALTLMRGLLNQQMGYIQLPIIGTLVLITGLSIV